MGMWSKIQEIKKDMVEDAKAERASKRAYKTVYRKEKVKATIHQAKRDAKTDAKNKKSGSVMSGVRLHLAKVRERNRKEQLEYEKVKKNRQVGHLPMYGGRQ